MDKKDWDDIVKEPMSESLKARTMARARQELDQMQKNSVFEWKWLAPLIPGLALLLFFINRDEDTGTEDSLTADLDYMDDLAELNEQELAELDDDILDDLDLLEDLDILEDWNGQSEES